MVEQVIIPVFESLYFLFYCEIVPLCFAFHFLPL